MEKPIWYVDLTDEQKARADHELAEVARAEAIAAPAKVELQRLRRIAATNRARARGKAESEAE